MSCRKVCRVKWHCRGYHGSPQHNARGVIQRYLGFWDCNPTTLIPLSPADSAPLYVEMMGGAEKILARGRQLHGEGKYLLASEILNKLVQAEPDNAGAKDLLADVFEQLGYQQENPGLRNSFLAAAYELRTGIPEGETASSSSPDVIRAMSTQLFLNFLAIRMDSRKAEGMRFTVNLTTPDNGERFIIELANATLTNIAGFQAKDPDLTLTINRSDLEQTMMGIEEARRRRSRTGRPRLRETSESSPSSPRPWLSLIPASRSCRAPRVARSEWPRPIRSRPCRERRLRNSGGPSRPFKGRWLNCTTRGRSCARPPYGAVNRVKRNPEDLKC